MANPFANLTADEAAGMTYRAHREAARCWAEFRACQDDNIRPVLRDVAVSAEAFWRLSRAEGEQIRSREEAAARLADGDHSRHVNSDHWLTCDECDDEAGEPDPDEESFGPVWNPDGSPTDVTREMLAGTGRTAADGAIS